MGERVTAFSSTRLGGCSGGNYSSFNVNRYCGDSEDDIARNLDALKTILGVGQVFMPHQVHGTEVLQVRHSVPWDGMAEDIEGVDALMTDVRGISIGVSTADCVPVLLYDEARHAAAAIHAGWRGTVKRIVEKTVASMQNAYGTLPGQLKAVIGPGISLEAFEVGDEVYDQFREAGFPMELMARRFAKWHIDLPLCNRLQLEAMGVRQVKMSGICTFRQSETYFSARKLGINSGRILTGIVLR